jgi:hypothetical protein
MSAVNIAADHDPDHPLTVKDSTARGKGHRLNRVPTTIDDSTQLNATLNMLIATAIHTAADHGDTKKCGDWTPVPIHVCNMIIQCAALKAQRGTSRPTQTLLVALAAQIGTTICLTGHVAGASDIVRWTPLPAAPMTRFLTKTTLTRILLFVRAKPMSPKLLAPRPLRIAL